MSIGGGSCKQSACSRKTGKTRQFSCRRTRWSRRNLNRKRRRNSIHLPQNCLQKTSRTATASRSMFNPHSWDVKCGVFSWRFPAHWKGEGGLRGMVLPNVGNNRSWIFSLLSQKWVKEQRKGALWGQEVLKKTCRGTKCCKSFKNCLQTAAAFSHQRSEGKSWACWLFKKNLRHYKPSFFSCRCCLR